MIIITRQRLKFLRAGRTLTIQDTTGRYKRGRDYALGLTHRTTVCRVEVLETTAGSIRIRIAQLRPVIYLAASPGDLRADYTDNPARAAYDLSGPIEAADIGWLAKEAKQTAERDDLKRREQARQMRLSRWRMLPSEPMR